MKTVGKKQKGGVRSDKVNRVTGVTLEKKKLVKEKKIHQRGTDRRTTRGKPMDAGRLI